MSRAVFRSVPVGADRALMCRDIAAKAGLPDFVCRRLLNDLLFDGKIHAEDRSQGFGKYRYAVFWRSEVEVTAA